MVASLALIPLLVIIVWLIICLLPRLFELAGGLFLIAAICWIASLIDGRREGK